MIASLATTAPNQFLDVGGTRFAYRRFGTPSGTPLVLTQHFMGNLDNFDPAISDARSSCSTTPVSAAVPAPPRTRLRVWRPTLPASSTASA
jgi:pimeloyl-ACP methyl ester carboxylesterase